LKHQVFNLIRNVTYVIPTRISSIEVDFYTTSESIAVSFRLLERTLNGNVEDPIRQITLTDAYNLLKKSVDQNDFKINFSNDIVIVGESLGYIEDQTNILKNSKKNTTFFFLFLVI
jgi:hypothetical protein